VALYGVGVILRVWQPISLVPCFPGGGVDDVPLSRRILALLWLTVTTLNITPFMARSWSRVAVANAILRVNFR